MGELFFVGFFFFFFLLGDGFFFLFAFHVNGNETVMETLLCLSVVKIQDVGQAFAGEL